MVKRILKIVGIILLILVAAAIVIYFVYLKPKPLPISVKDRAAITLMPLPASLKLSGDVFALTSEFGVSPNGPEDEIVSKAIKRFVERTQTQSDLTFKADGKGLDVRYSTATAAVQPVEIDESYQLTIETSGISVDAASGYGVLRALESLSQLLKSQNGNFVWPTLKIKDSPRYAWRGLMIDVSRHWIPKEIILRNIEAMAAVKLSVLHWHLSDYQGIRVESKLFPKLQELGSEGNFYTQNDIKEVVTFARDRGIRVVPEFDMPGHATSFLTGYPELASAPGPYKLDITFGLLPPVMDPTREEVYAFIDSFVGEMAPLFPDTYFHIGGDEVDASHWKNNEAIQKFMKDNAIENTHDLQAYFNQRVEKILAKHDKKMIGWDEILNPKLSNSIVVQSWRSHKSLFEALQKGSKAILSSGYYLDYKKSAAIHYGVDPEVLPGAVTITPDSLNWSQYTLSIYVSESPLEAQLVLYGQQETLRGLFFAMGNYTGFDNATRNGNDLAFAFDSDYGKIKIESAFSGDSLKGKLSLGLLSFPFKGKKIGGNDWPGTTAPKVELIKPLTAEQKKNILGGEAAIWTESVSAANIDSRIWPRMAAMAEKWWTPQELTKDVNDMYRRLWVVSSYIKTFGIRHVKGQDEMITTLAEGKDEKAIRVLIDVLEEFKYPRIDVGVTTLTPLNEVVDAAQPESVTAVKFAKMVDEFLADAKHEIHRDSIRETLMVWQNNHIVFEKVAVGNARLEKVLQTSKELAMMSTFALHAFDTLIGKGQYNQDDKKAMLKEINGVDASRAGTILAVAPALKKLAEAF